MNTTTLPGANARLLPTLRSALGRALQWRLWLLFVAASLLCALVAGLPVFNWLAGVLDNSVHAGAIAAGEAPALLADALMARNAPLPLLGQMPQLLPPIPWPISIMSPRPVRWWVCQGLVTMVS